MAKHTIDHATGLDVAHMRGFVDYRLSTVKVGDALVIKGRLMWNDMTEEVDEQGSKSLVPIGESVWGTIHYHHLPTGKQNVIVEVDGVRCEGVAEVVGEAKTVTISKRVSL